MAGRREDRPRIDITTRLPDEPRRLPAVQKHLGTRRPVAKAPPSSARRRNWRQFGENAVLLFSLVLVVRAVFLEPFGVSTGSMSPTVLPGDRLLVDKNVFEWRQPRRWEMVVFRAIDGPAKPLLKRVVGLPGESIEVRDGEVVINGEVVRRPDSDVYYTATGKNGIGRQCRLGPDEYYVLGDNSGVSDDSRMWPTPGVPHRLLLGKPLVRHAAWRSGHPGSTTFDWGRLGWLR